MGREGRVGCCSSLSTTVYVSSARYLVHGVSFACAEHYAASKLEGSLAMPAMSATTNSHPLTLIGARFAHTIPSQGPISTSSGKLNPHH